MIIDFHTHAFPDDLAPRAIGQLSQMAEEVKPYTDGTVAGLLRSMDEAGIDRSILAHVATKPDQFDAIMSWSDRIRSDRIEPFPSIHPADPNFAENVRRVAAEGYRGIKLHPYYQGFGLCAQTMISCYEALVANGLVLLCHTGYDIGYPRDPICTPAQVAQLHWRVPELKLVGAHFGGWGDWDAAADNVVGKEIYVDLSTVAIFIGVERTREFILSHPSDYMLFGTDSPWRDQAAALDMIRGMNLGPELEAGILGGNAARLLGFTS